MRVIVSTSCSTIGIASGLSTAVDFTMSKHKMSLPLLPDQQLTFGVTPVQYGPDVAKSAQRIS
jgi:hypothetical protein